MTSKSTSRPRRTVLERLDRLEARDRERERLERRVSAIEAVLNGRLANLGDGLRGLNDVNNAMNRSMQEIRQALFLRNETGAEKPLEHLARVVDKIGGRTDA